MRWETSSHPWEWIAARSIVAWRLINVEVRGQSAALQGDAYICMNIQEPRWASRDRPSAICVAADYFALEDELVALVLSVLLLAIFSCSQQGELLSVRTKVAENKAQRTSLQRTSFDSRHFSQWKMLIISRIAVFNFFSNFCSIYSYHIRFSYL